MEDCKYSLCVFQALLIEKTLHNVTVMPNGHSGATWVQKETWPKN